MTQKSLHWLDEADSTNTHISQMYDKGRLSSQNQTLYTVATLNQRLGVGRRGTRWIDSPGCSLAFSTFLTVGQTSIRFIPMLASLAIYNSLRALTGLRNFAIKWPNDVLQQGKKLCGVMGTVLSATPSSPHTPPTALDAGIPQSRTPPHTSHPTPHRFPLCVGIGINMFTPVDLLPTSDATSLLPQGFSLSHRNRLLQGKLEESEKIDICTELISRWVIEFTRYFLPCGVAESSCPRAMPQPAFLCTPKDSFLKDYKAACSTIGKKIKFLISAENKTLTGIATDIDPLGNIEIQSGSEKFVFDSAQISKVQIYV